MSIESVLKEITGQVHEVLEQRQLDDDLAKGLEVVECAAKGGGGYSAALPAMMMALALCIDMMELPDRIIVFSRIEQIANKFADMRKSGVLAEAMRRCARGQSDQ